ncbi:MAG: hypothetical protein ABIW85_10815 [Variovorax sp.]
MLEASLTTRCPWCSASVDAAAAFCQRCGKALERQGVRGGAVDPVLLVDVPLPELPSALSRTPASVPVPGAVTPANPHQVSAGDGGVPARPRRGRRLGAWVLVAIALAVVGAMAGAVTAWFSVDAPSATEAELRRALQQAGAAGTPSGRDVVCIVDGLAYDSFPAYVPTTQTERIEWLDQLAAAGLYAPGQKGLSGGFFAQPIRVYQPLATLAPWGGDKRLCLAKGVRIDALHITGPTQDWRLRGRTFPSVSADVYWTFEQPAPWLARARLAEVALQALPAWGGARWQQQDGQWRLQRRHRFVWFERRWITEEAADRLTAAAS